MNFTKTIIAFTIFISTATALGARPAAAEAYLMLTKSDHLRNQLTSKLRYTNRAVLKQRVKNAKLRATLFRLLEQPTADSQNEKSKIKSNKRMNRFRQFHS